jgi:hypothetical protein
VLASHLSALWNADFGNDRFGGIKVFFAHVAIIAIAAILSQANFAIFAMEFFAQFASIAA